VYVSDLLDLKGGAGNSINIPTTIKLEMISKDSFTENKDQIPHVSFLIMIFSHSFPINERIFLGTFLKLSPLLSLLPLAPS
ncbi:MAG: hypothetical protein NDF52_00655, partial [archaeon YNP-WB-062]|nr:hypothetical protein [Candidatus Culexarchaeum yellowstonense]